MTMRTSPTGSDGRAPHVIVVANKSDNERREAEMWEFMSLGIGEPVPVSALHGRRAGDLLDRVIELFPEHLRKPTFSKPDPWATEAPVENDDQPAGARRAGHRRAAERRQEHAVQPAGGGGPFGGPRPRRDDP